jgi:hypothetical protein
VFGFVFAQWRSTRRIERRSNFFAPFSSLLFLSSLRIFVLNFIAVQKRKAKKGKETKTKKKHHYFFAGPPIRMFVALIAPFVAPPVLPEAAGGVGRCVTEADLAAIGGLAAVPAVVEI